MLGRGRERLRPTWRLAALGVFVCAGALFVTTAIDADGLDLRASSVSDLPTVVRQERARVDGLQSDLSSLTRDIDRLGRGVGDADVRRLQREVDALREPAGFAAVRGPAVTVSLTDAPDDVVDDAVAAGVSEKELVVHQQDIQAVVNALWLGGAEAMTIMGQRVISSTGIKCIGNTVFINGQSYAPPYVVTAVGDRNALLQALADSEYVAGYRTYVDAYDLGYEVTTAESVDLPAYERSAELRFAAAVSPDTEDRD